MTTRTRDLLVAAALLFCLVAGSWPRLVGDGPEYVAQALNFAHFSGPAIGRQAIPDIERTLAEADPAFADWQLAEASRVGQDRRRDFIHFWFYALLVTPAVWITQLTGLPVLAAFTLTNAALLLLALWVALPRLGSPAVILLFASPVVWWLDKAHTEVFTFSLLLLAVLLVRDRPWWALVAAGAAAAQNPPIVAVWGLVGTAAVVADPSRLRDRRFVAGAIAGLALAALHPVYTWWRYDTPSLLLDATRPGLPTTAEWLAVPLDPSIGLVGNAPIVVLAAIAALAVVARRNWRRLVTPEMGLVVASGIAFLYAFGRTANVHHGATPSLSRYAIWLLPLAAPLLAEARSAGGNGWRRALATMAVVSAAVSIVAFHPRVWENSREPTWAATWLWTSHPTWNDPLPEVFTETHVHREAFVVPVATSGCEKVLLVSARDGGEVAWPIPCYPAVVTPDCRTPYTLCYANRSGDGYAFRRAPGRRRASEAVPNALEWTSAMAPRIRAIYDAWGWRSAPPPRAGVVALRQYQDVSVMALGDDARFLLVLAGFGEAPVLRFRFAEPMRGALADPATDTVIASLSADGDPETVVSVEPPRDRDLLVLTMTSDAPR